VAAGAGQQSPAWQAQIVPGAHAMAWLINWWPIQVHPAASVTARHTRLQKDLDSVSQVAQPWRSVYHASRGASHTCCAYIHLYPQSTHCQKLKCI